MLSSYRLLDIVTASTQDGDIAQLGERCLRKAEAEGSNPFISTMQTSRAALLACAFFIREQRGRNFGYIASLGYIVNFFGIRYVRALSSSLQGEKKLWKSRVLRCFKYASRCSLGFAFLGRAAYIGGGRVGSHLF